MNMEEAIQMVKQRDMELIALVHATNDNRSTKGRDRHFDRQTHNLLVALTDDNPTPGDIAEVTTW